ncbi:hypothetical protein GOBAR_DD24190 [Gossypium barbadense]|nr:hypothetical protein GOBAR_DD24190 [Gossypium barbadense]
MRTTTGSPYGRTVSGTWLGVCGERRWKRGSWGMCEGLAAAPGTSETV